MANAFLRHLLLYTRDRLQLLVADITQEPEPRSPDDVLLRVQNLLAYVEDRIHEYRDQFVQVLEITQRGEVNIRRRSRSRSRGL